MKPHRGAEILVFGILSILVCGLFDPFAWVMGNADLKEMNAGTMDLTGRSLTDAGRICGMIITILMIAGAVVGFGILMLGLAGALFSAGA